MNSLGVIKNFDKDLYAYFVKEIGNPNIVRFLSLHKYSI